MPETTERLIPIDPIVTNLLSRLNDNLREEFEERAGILEFDALYPRRLAECLGLLDVLRRNLSSLSGVTGMQIVLDGQTQYLAVTSVEHASQHIADIHAEVVSMLDLREMLEEQYGGTACLTFLG